MIANQSTQPLISEMAKLAVGTVRVRTRIRSSHSEGDFNSLPPEPQQGNVEYKLKLVNPTAQRLEHLVTQMKWRLREGQGEAIYEIGVEDNGLMTGLSDIDMDSSIETLREMARRLEATIQVYHTVRNLHFLSKNSTLISRENCPFFCVEKLVKMLWFWTF